MSFDIVKAYPADFPVLTQSIPAADVLQAQVNAAIASADCLAVTIGGGSVLMTFDVEPSAGDKTLIDNVCAVHTGEPFVQAIQKTFSEAVQTEPGTTYVQKASLMSGPLAGGEYLITWYCEISVQAAGGTTSGALARVMWNGTERAEHSNSSDFYTSFSGAVIVGALVLETPALVVELRRIGTNNTARIRRIRMSISPAG